ncbi:hypothetical protein CYK16_05125 [Streptococcus oralis subsp. dentisani]|uniref:Transposase IS116/IS110/IS902 C-terminal domain-containing protein n=1 Tax=Streptococcus oralis subsp. dentisani TaxID=1458253 RepID=A0A2I1UF64_STROR|nr:hypothetical protein CYK16_05125 [Streptococcus oralis subsp. dentisani]
MIQTIPGVNENCAATILAEIGPTVTAFTSDAHLTSWAGLCPGSYESAGIKKSSHITQGNRYIKQALTLSGLILRIQLFFFLQSNFPKSKQDESSHRLCS